MIYVMIFWEATFNIVCNVYLNFAMNKNTKVNTFRVATEIMFQSPVQRSRSGIPPPRLRVGARLLVVAALRPDLADTSPDSQNLVQYGDRRYISSSHRSQDVFSDLITGPPKSATIPPRAVCICRSRVVLILKLSSK